MKVRALIADDEELCRRQIRRFLAENPAVDVVAESSNGAETLNAIRESAPDLVFLDIKMPELDAFEVLQQLDGSKIPAIIFVTAHDEFAVQAFDSDAVDYLLKPFDRDRFQRAYRRALNRISNVSESQKARQLKDLLDFVNAGQSGVRRFTIKTNGRIVLIKAEDVDWISSADNYSELHVGKSSHLLRSSLTALAEQLAGANFVRVSRGALVNQDRIRQIAIKSHGDALITLTSGATVTATRTYRQFWRGLLNSLQ